jgi:hypothetical protein
MGHLSALPDLLIWTWSYLGNWVSSETSDKIYDSIVDDMDDWLVRL